VKIFSSTYIHLSSVHGVMNYPSIPKFLKLLKTIGFYNSCFSVCSYEGSTYIGLQHSIVRINEDFTLTELVTSDDSVRAVTVYKDKLYALTDSYLQSRKRCTIWYQVRVYTLDGNEVTSWRHSDESRSKNKLMIIDDQIVIPDKSNTRITVYSLVGEVVKHILCPLLDQNSEISMCAADSHCVVVSDSSQVFKLDLTTEKVIWTCEDVSKPQGVTCYRSKYILVTKEDSTTTICILDMKTG